MSKHYGSNELFRVLKNNDAVFLDLSGKCESLFEKQYLSYHFNYKIPIKKINFSYNKVELQGLGCLLQILRENIYLTSLNLSHNEIGDSEVKSLVKFLKHNSTLTSLDLSYNKISVDGINLLNEAMYDGSLKSIKLHGNIDSIALSGFVTEDSDHN